MSRHEGVSCDSCMKGNFRGRRFKCLICYDYDLCSGCFEQGASTPRHAATHPMQCILTRSDNDLYFGGESALAASEHQHSFTCPFCSKMGYTEATLQEHVSSLHSEASQEVVCPICASFPGGDPNHVTDDFQGHLNLEHRAGTRDLISFLDEPGGVHRQGAVRRIAHGRGGGSLQSHRTRRHNNPPPTSAAGGSASSLSTLSPSSREPVDPIAELLSQLSGVRRAAGSSSQLHQLQMELQLQRQQAQAQRQTLDRLARRPPTSSAPNPQVQPNPNGANGAGGSNNTASSSSVKQASTSASEASGHNSSSSNFLLDELSSEDGSLASSPTGEAAKNLFLGELLLGALSIQSDDEES